MYLNLPFPWKPLLQFSWWDPRSDVCRCWSPSCEQTDNLSDRTWKTENSFSNKLTVNITYIIHQRLLCLICFLIYAQCFAISLFEVTQYYFLCSLDELDYLFSRGRTCWSESRWLDLLVGTVVRLWPAVLQSRNHRSHRMLNQVLHPRLRDDPEHEK